MTGPAAFRRPARPRQKDSAEAVTDVTPPSFTPTMDPTGPGTSGPLDELDEAGIDLVERLISGSSGSADWFEVAELFDRLRGEGAVDVDDLRVRHNVAAAAAVARRVNASLVPTARRRDHHLRVGVAAAAATVAASVGLASADTLPQPLQTVVSHVVAIVGVEVPDGHTRPPTGPLLPPADDPAPAPVIADPAAVSTTPATSTPATTAAPGTGRAGGGTASSAGGSGGSGGSRFEPVAPGHLPGAGRGDPSAWRSWAEKRFDDLRDLRRAPDDDARLGRESVTPPWVPPPWVPPPPSGSGESSASVSPPFDPRSLLPGYGGYARGDGGGAGDDSSVGVASVPSRSDPSDWQRSHPTAEQTPTTRPSVTSWLLGRLSRRGTTSPWADRTGGRR